MSVRVIDSPYKGLAPFDDSDLDALLFFGRERERGVIVANVLASRLTVLYGETGVGKSSVLRAGVVREVRNVAPEADVRLLASWADHRPLELGDDETYLIFDQFEEYFVYYPGGGPLLYELPELLDRPRVNILISLREDALAQLDAFKGRVPNLFGNYLRLDHLDRSAARSAILGPVDRYNELTGEKIQVEPALVATVLDEVASGRLELASAGLGTANDSLVNRIEAPYLQLVLEQLWEAEREAGSSVLRLETLKRLGGSAAIVGDHLEHAMKELSDAQKEAAAAMYNYLVTPSGTKIAHRAGDLAGYANVPEPEASAVLEKLARERILRSRSANGAASARYEIYHDVLADAVLAWRARHQTERALRETDRRRRRARAIATAALIALLIVAAVAVFALLERSREQTQARNAHAQQLAADALTKLDSDPEASVRLALSAALLEPKHQEEDVLRNALTRDRERAVLRAGGPVRIASFDTRGKRVLAAGDDGKARVYDRSGHLLATFDHGAPIAAAASATRGGLVATGGGDGEVKVWRRSAVHPIATLAAGDGAVRAVAFDRHTARLYSVTSRGTIRGWSVSRRFARVAEIRTGIRATGATLARSGRFIVVIAHDRFARVYALPSGRFARRLAQKGYIGNVDFSPDERLVLTTGNEGTVRLWRVGSWRLVRELRGPLAAVTEAVFSRDGRLIGAASKDDTVRVWETATGFQRAIMIGHTNELTSVAFNPDASAVVSASTDGTARVWDIGGRPTSVLAGHGATVFGATFSPDGNSVVTAGEDGTARLWDPGSEPDLRAVQSRRVIDLALAADGRRFVTAGDGLVVWTTSPLHRIRRLSGANARLPAITSDGSLVAASFGQNRVVVFNTRNGSVLTRFRAPGAPTAVAFDRANRLLAAAGSSIAIWDRHGLRSVREVTTVDDLAASPDGTLIATAGEDGKVRLRDARTWALRSTLRGHKAAVTSARFSAHGQQLVTASRDEDVRLWDVSTGRTERTLHWHSGPVFDAAISPDGRWIVTAGPITAGIGLATTAELFRPGTYLRGPTGALTAVGFGGPAGRLVVAASKDGTLRTFACDFCGDVHDLIALARRRLRG